MHLLPSTPWVNIVALLISLVVLTKSADLLVDGAVGVAKKLNVPKIIIGIVLVGFATTAPEFTVSVISAVRGFPEIALGNAIGSVIVDDTLALGLGIIVAPKAIKVDSRVLRTTGLFLVAIDVIAFLLALNGVISRFDGMILVALLVGYLIVVVTVEKKRKAAGATTLDDAVEIDEYIKPGPLQRQLLLFAIGVLGLILASDILVESAVNIAHFLAVPEGIIALTVIAIGTSIPEIATSITAFKKGHGDLSLGNIIGADILNVLWIIGASAIANPITVSDEMLYFAFPVMIGVVVLMLVLARVNFRLDRWKGFLLLSVYVAYLVVSITVFFT